MPLRDAVADLVEAILGPRIDRLALYPATVVSQAGDGTVDVFPDDAKVRGLGLSGLRLRYGLPGFVATVPALSRVLIGWEAGDPTRPYAMAWEAGAVTSVTFDGGTEDVARTGDTAGELYIDSNEFVAAVASAMAAVPPAKCWLYYRTGSGAWAPVIMAPMPPLAPGVGTSIVIDEGNAKLHA